MQDTNSGLINVQFSHVREEVFGQHTFKKMVVYKHQQDRKTKLVQQGWYEFGIFGEVATIADSLTQGTIILVEFRLRHSAKLNDKRGAFTSVEATAIYPVNVPYPGGAQPRGQGQQEEDAAAGNANIPF